jgi:alpha-beta hydrolase superfamily lysophospholipase
MVEHLSEKVKLGDTELCFHFWNKTNSPGSVVIIYHGFGAHGLYPTVRYAAELLAGASCTVLAADMRGHGQSPGLEGFIPSVDTLLDDACQVADYALTEFKPKKLFLLGSSMGGTIALQVAQRRPENIAGVLLLAPMLKLSVSSVEQTLLSCLATVVPEWKIIPSSSTNAEMQYRDEAKRQECENDRFTSKSKTIRVGSAYCCVFLAKSVDFSKVEVPIFIGVADEDVVVDKQGSLDLFDQAPSTDKTIKRYAALHGLLCEPSPLFDEIAKNILDWIHDRQ